MTANSDDIMTLQVGQVTCKIAAEARADLEPWLAAMDLDTFEVVKSTRVRTVYRGVIQTAGESLSVHCKTHRAITLADRTRDSLRGARGVREFDHLVQARARGLLCVRPLAAGRLVSDATAHSFLLTETLATAEPMPRTDWSPAEATAAGIALRAAHDAGLHAHDLHPENLLLAGATPAAERRAHLCDLTSVVLANPLECDQRAHALAFFCRELDGLIEDPVAAPLLEAYGAGVKLRRTAQQAARRLRNRLLSAFGRRATRACRHTSTTFEVGPPKTRWYLHVPADETEHAAARAWQASRAVVATKSGRRGSVHLEDRMVVKRRNPTAARALFRAAYWLLHIGVPTPRPIALVLARQTGTVFVARIARPSLSVEFADLTASQRSAAAKDLGNSLGRLHAFGLRNRDLKFENLVRDPNDADRVCIVDLDGVRRRRPTEPRGQARDLGRLLAAVREHLSGDRSQQTQLLRAFLRGYYTAFRCLRANANPRLRQHSEARADEWASAHSDPTLR